ncbi:hypothetical protein LCGC14_2848900 [marine sediment metagenome]|uniref:Uncharacterized protein n=1 Tax=marine sediment metagenome TaxID=412755 RepID=A0A0F8Y978_9ZZZZ
MCELSARNSSSWLRRLLGIKRNKRRVAVKSPLVLRSERARREAGIVEVEVPNKIGGRIIMLADELQKRKDKRTRT